MSLQHFFCNTFVGILSTEFFFFDPVKKWAKSILCYYNYNTSPPMSGCWPMCAIVLELLQAGLMRSHAVAVVGWERKNYQWGEGGEKNKLCQMWKGLVGPLDKKPSSLVRAQIKVPPQPFCWREKWWWSRLWPLLAERKEEEEEKKTFFFSSSTSSRRCKKTV